ncbi:MAG: hypothetical protein LBG46_01450 [Elusimicrobiota bacterium]|jgi:adenine-specific DNA methylase|nr:hypothetical protein [Elusimicrobiota bacterium]
MEEIKIDSLKTFCDLFARTGIAGRMFKKEAKSIIGNDYEKYGKYDAVKQKYQRFKADKTGNRNHKANSTYEFIHILEK